MKRQFIFLFALAALLLFAGGRSARAYTEPYVSWDPQSLSYPVGADAEYSATVSGQDLEFTWYVEYGGKEYEIPKQKDALMAAGLQSYCDDVEVKSTANRTTIIFRNIKIGIDGWSGHWTRVYCHAFDGNTGVDTNFAHVGCNGYGKSEAGMPPQIYIKPVINFQPSDVGKVGSKILNVDDTYVSGLSYQWYHYSGGSYDKGLKLITGEDESIYVAGGSEDLVLAVNVKLKTGGSYWIYSSPVNVNRLTGDVDYSYDQLRIVKTPDRLSYTLGDELDLTGLQAEYIAGGKSQGIVPISLLEADITNFLYAGPVWVNVSCKGETNGFTVWVEPKNGDWEYDAPKYLEAQTSGVKMTYKPGDKLDTSGLKVKVTLQSGASYVESDLSKFDIKCAAFTEGGIYTVHIYMKGWSAEGNYLVSVIPPETSPAPTTEEEATSAETPTQPDETDVTGEPAPSETETEPALTEEPAQPESSSAGTTEEPEASSSAAAPAQSTEAAPNGGSGGVNTVLIVLIIIMACVIGLLAGILIGKKKEK